MKQLITYLNILVSKQYFFFMLAILQYYILNITNIFNNQLYITIIDILKIEFPLHRSSSFTPSMIFI